MPDRTPGKTALTDPAKEWFKFWHTYLHADDDPRFVMTWEAAIKVGARIGSERNKRWSGLIPLLEDLLAAEREHLIEHAAERWALSNANAEEHAIRASEELEELPF